MISETSGLAGLAIGAVAVLLAVLADTLGIGGEPGFGWKQGILLGAGVLLAGLGAGVLFLARAGGTERGP